MRSSPWVESLVPWIVPLALLLTWWFVSERGLVQRKTLPSPLSVAQAAIRLTRSGELPKHLAESSKRAAIGLGIGGTLGFALALINGLSTWANRLFDSSIQMFRNIPHLALIPLVIMWFGVDESAKQCLIVSGVLFPIYINTLHGIRSVDPRLVEMGRVYGFSSWSLFRHVILPGSLPSVFVGLRYALGVTWLTLIVAETVASDNGIGFMTMNARDFLQTDVVLLGILLYAFLGKLADTIARSLERWFIRWNPAYA